MLGTMTYSHDYPCQKSFAKQLSQQSSPIVSSPPLRPAPTKSSTVQHNFHAPPQVSDGCAGLQAPEVVVPRRSKYNSATQFFSLNYNLQPLPSCEMVTWGDGWLTLCVMIFSQSAAFAAHQLISGLKVPNGNSCSWTSPWPFPSLQTSKPSMVSLFHHSSVDAPLKIVSTAAQTVLSSW